MGIDPSDHLLHLGYLAGRKEYRHVREQVSLLNHLLHLGYLAGRKEYRHVREQVSLAG
ncbi:hypothetical protein [Aurantimonas coralicida]|uniref:hypothetical protein n=1 Tax=Aurantimonas coralicida TaxID=182270 RepID=UPI001FD1D906|nr:hypothetical protein [Aurantimonas coralicida]